jgi:ubiquinone/menaquinone biosynthesis C-methylase UbiE
MMMSFDANDYRQASLESWEEAAPGWVTQQRLMREFTAPVSHWMVEAISPQPGQRVLELAAGLGETAMLAAELVAPMGGVVISDQAEAMLEGARARALELSLNNIEFRVLNAEWIDLPLASVDGVLCRWGIMLMADPATALGETRRVLRPGGRLAIAVWDSIEHNPWASLPAEEMAARSQAPEAEQSANLDPSGPAESSGGAPSPGPFALASPAKVSELLEQAGFSDIEVQAVDLLRRHSSFEELWETTLDLSRGFHDAVLSRPENEIADIRASLAERFAPYTSGDGSLEIPGRTLVASAGA